METQWQLRPEGSPNVMTGEIGAGADKQARSDASDEVSRLVPMRIGDATVFLSRPDRDAVIEESDEIRPVVKVTLPSPQEAFEQAGAFLCECVRIFDDRIGRLAHQPGQITVEFALSFEVTGKAALVPVFITGETKGGTAIKVTAVWGRESEAGSS
jgi:hypothetical protein